MRVIFREKQRLSLQVNCSKLSCLQRFSVPPREFQLPLLTLRAISQMEIDEKQRISAS